MSCLLLGHRGASLAYPENTLAALRSALESPCVHGIECDVRLTADGVPVLFHDDTTERLCDSTGPVEMRPLAEVRALRVRGQPVPTLEEALRCCFDLRPHLASASLNLELKPASDPDRLLRACARAIAPWPSGALLVSSFDPRVVARARVAGLTCRLALLYEDAAALSALPHLAPAGVVDLHPSHRLVDAEHLERWSAPGRAFRTWTVDDAPTALRLERLGVAAIVTNRPAELARELAGLRERGTDPHA